MKKILLLLIVGLVGLQAACKPHGETGLQKIMSMSTPPAGVVFEIASDDDEGFAWAVPLVNSYARQLRKKFPDIKLAIVSHGEEQFQLTKDNRDEFADVHQKVVSLINQQDIDVHVCGNLAASQGVDEDKFIDDIDVAARGPTQIKVYQQNGYEVLFIHRPQEGEGFNPY